MNISKLKLVLKYLTGGVGSVADYLLDVLNAALANIDPANKQKIQLALNTAQRVAATLSAFAWLCPTRWQTAYAKTIAAVEAVTASLADLKLEPAELERIKSAFSAAVGAWRSPDDETCVDCCSECGVCRI